MTPKEHYSTHLAKFYAWMIGNFAEKQSAQQDFFHRNNIKPGNNKVAIDLGAGNGLQSVSLAKLGYNVLAVDFNAELLGELKVNSNDLPVEIVVDDLADFLGSYDQKAGAIICMGDTITHLESMDHVERLLKMMSEHLEPDGKIAISFRELTQELKGEQRFIPVRSDDSRILTCFLEYFPNHVIVHDILHEKRSDKWMQKVSSYPKLRISEKFLVDAMRRCQIKTIATERVNGMLYLVGEKIN